MQMVGELTAASVPLNTATKRAFISSFVDSVESRPMRFYDCLSAATAAGMAEEIRLLQDSQGIAFDGNAEDTTKCMSLLRKLGATTRLAIIDIRQELREDYISRIRTSVNGDSFQEQRWCQAMTWHRCQEAESKLTCRTLSVRLPDTIVAMIDVFLLGAPVPSCNDTLHEDGDQKKMLLEEEESEPEAFDWDISADPDWDTLDTHSNGENLGGEPEHENHRIGDSGVQMVPWDEHGNADVERTLGSETHRSDFPRPETEQSQHMEPPRSHFQLDIQPMLNRATSAADCSEIQHPEYKINIAVLSRSTGRILEELGDGCSLRYHREALETQGYSWQLQGGGFVFVDPLLYRQVLQELEGMELRTTASLVVFSESAEVHVQEALQVGGGFLMASRKDDEGYEAGQDCVAAVTSNNGGSPNLEVMHHDGILSHITLDVVRTFICAVHTCGD
jgi:hypothetical protein